MVLRSHDLVLHCMQGKVGVINNFTLVLLNELGQVVSGQASQISASLSLFPAPVTSSSKFIQAVANSEGGGVVVVWNGTAATPANNSVVFQLNVTVKSSSQVCF